MEQHQPIHISEDVMLCSSVCYFTATVEQQDELMFGLIDNDDEGSWTLWFDVDRGERRSSSRYIRQQRVRRCGNT